MGRGRPRKFVADLYPYFSVGGTLDTGERASFAPVVRYGGDAKLRFGTDATVDVTVLPEFGTVEADTAVFNLTTAELRFPEKRPFFQEGVDVLTTPLSVFYSRRIGSRSGTTAGNAVEAPPPAPVLGAAKLLWRVGRRGTVALLAAETGAQDVLVRSPDDGVAAPQRVLPYFTYALARGQVDLPNGGYVGAMAGGRVSFDRGPTGPWTACPDRGAPQRGSCFPDAYFLSADALVRNRDGRFWAQGQVVGTLRWGGTPEVLIDGNTLESGDLGGAARLRLEKAGGRMIGWIDYTWLGRDADWNATGFLPVPDRHKLRAHLGWQTLTPHGPLLEKRWQYEWVQRFNLDGLSTFEAYQFNHRAKWRSFWRHFVELHLRPRRWDDREARDGTPVERAGVLGLELELTSDHRRRVVWDLSSTTQVRTTGGLGTYGMRAEVDTSLDVVPAGPVQLRLGLSGTYDDGEMRWVGADPAAAGRRFARPKAGALGVLLRVNYTLSPRLELQLYTQLLGAGTVYDDGHVVPMANTRVRLGALIPDPDFEPERESEALLVANLFLRWRFAPGSNLYLVLTRNQTDPTVPGGDGGLDLSRLGRMAASYLFLVKVIHRFAL